MARALAQKRVSGQKSSKAVGPVKKAKAKQTPRTSPGKLAPKGKVSPRGGSSRRVEEKTTAHKPEKTLTNKTENKNIAKRMTPKPQTAPPARHSVHKERIMEAESRKPAIGTGISSALDAPPRLLHPTKTTNAALAILEKGIDLIFKKEFKKARTELKSLLETYPGELDILARARTYIQICDREEANQKRAAIPAISTDQLYALGVLEHNRSNYDKAISFFLQSLEKHQKADYIYYSVAASFALKGDLDAALENLRKAVELNDDSRVYAKNDPDFSALQENQEFATLIGLGSPTAESR